MITYLVGDATRPDRGGVKIIAHICNDIGLWGAGFTAALDKRWSEPRTSYKLWHTITTSGFFLGKTQVVQVESDTYVANMVAQHEVAKAGSAYKPIRYEAVRLCLEDLNRYIRDRLNSDPDTDLSIHMPRIGCGLAGGSWDKIEPLLSVIPYPVYVYDLGDTHI